MCMFTLSKKNMNQLTEVIRLAAEIGLDGFDFDRIVPVGSAQDMKEEVIDPWNTKNFCWKLTMSIKSFGQKAAALNLGIKTICGACCLTMRH